MRVVIVSALAGTLALAACAPPAGDLMVHIPPHIAASGYSALAQAPPRPVALPEFGEAGADPSRIGDRSISGNPPGVVVMTPPPGQVLHDAFAAELRRAGHELVPEAAVAIEGRVLTFALRLTPALYGWKMVLEANLGLAARGGGQTVNHAYATRCADATTSTPAPGAVAALIEHCVDDLAIQFRSDAEVAHVLGAP